jgi:ABC-type sugar transport system permease subunit
MLGWTVYTSMSAWQGTAPDFEFVGFKWYEMMFGMERFKVDLVNNLKWLIFGVIPTVVFALFIAYLLEIGTIKGAETYIRTLLLYPVAMSFVVTGTIWSWMYQPDRGVINTILRGIGLDAFQGKFISDPNQATNWLIVIFVYLSAIQTRPPTG